MFKPKMFYTLRIVGFWGCLVVKVVKENLLSLVCIISNLKLPCAIYTKDFTLCNLVEAVSAEFLKLMKSSCRDNRRGNGDDELRGRLTPLHFLLIAILTHSLRISATVPQLDVDFDALIAYLQLVALELHYSHT